MRLNTQSRYAVMAMVDIALNSETGPVNIESISWRQNISINYLEQILSKLKRAKMVKAVRGPGGGYLLACAAEYISIFDIMRSLGEINKMTRCDGKHGCLPDSAKCKTHKLWQEMGDNINGYLASVSLASFMSENFIYFDNNATVKPVQEAITAMSEVLGSAYNSSSVHAMGRTGRKFVEEARANLAGAVNAENNREFDIIFTSSGTEANNIIINSFDHIICSKIEHLSVLEPAKAKNCDLINCDKNGVVDLGHLHKLLKKSTGKQVLISVMHANNETGVVQPIKEIAELAVEYGALLHTDASQSFGKIKVDFQELGVDLATFSSHKCGGPQGAAAIVKKASVKLSPLIVGGGQERGMRAGTENVAAIYGFGVAVNLIEARLKKMAEIKKLRDYLENILVTKGAWIHASTAERLPNTTMMASKNLNSELQLIHFDSNNIAVSAGSACSSGKTHSSHVLEAMEIDEEMIKSTIRISLGPDNTKQQVDRFISVWDEINKRVNGELCQKSA